ncbi:hypothetical protein [Candidatus Enterovibrio altilux]|nr:hypothetical protein [Candidatus Enterovibrio luxaltus]
MLRVKKITGRDIEPKVAQGSDWRTLRIIKVLSKLLVALGMLKTNV